MVARADSKWRFHLDFMRRLMLERAAIPSPIFVNLDDWADWEVRAYSNILGLSKFDDCIADNTYSGCTAAQCAWCPDENGHDQTVADKCRFRVSR
jgi:hypothetical protein